jgi:hypothetical protein
MERCWSSFMLERLLRNNINSINSINSVVLALNLWRGCICGSVET